MTVSAETLRNMTDKELAEHLNSFKQAVEDAVKLIADTFAENDVRPEVGAQACSMMESWILNYLESKMGDVDEQVEVLKQRLERVESGTTDNVVQFRTRTVQ